MPDPTFVLLHSPLVGPASWRPVHDAIHLEGFQVATPRIEDRVAPYWRSYVDSAIEALRALVEEEEADEVVLVPHSGAGTLAAAIAAESPIPIAGIVFVDAALPEDGWTRLQEMETHDAEFAREIRRELEGGLRAPAWTDELLAALIPDEDRRVALLAEVQPRGLDFFEEPIPAPSWPPSGRRPHCAYLQLSSHYAAVAQEAEALGWPVGRIDAGHFHALVAPEVVGAVVLRLYEESSRRSAS